MYLSKAWDEVRFAMSKFQGRWVDRKTEMSFCAEIGFVFRFNLTSTIHGGPC